MVKYYDIDMERIYTLAELRLEWDLLTEDEKGTAETFDEYLMNCLSKNGSLVPVYPVENVHA